MPLRTAPSQMTASRASWGLPGRHQVSAVICFGENRLKSPIRAALRARVVGGGLRRPGERREQGARGVLLAAVESREQRERLEPVAEFDLHPAPLGEAHLGHMEEVGAPGAMRSSPARASDAGAPKESSFRSRAIDRRTFASPSSAADCMPQSPALNPAFRAASSGGKPRAM